VAVDRFLEGSTVPWLEPDELELELELLELDELADTTHGATMSVVTLLLAGTTSWFWGAAPVAGGVVAPPGVTSTVLAAGGAAEELLLELELLLLEPPAAIHGWIATVSVSVLRGTTSWLDPGGMAVLPDCATLASEQGGTTIVSGVCCLGITTVRTPGFISAVDTGSWLELDELLLDPHAVKPAASAVVVRMQAPIRAAPGALRVMPSSRLSPALPRQAVR
jgi:hypothetical protein